MKQGFRGSGGKGGNPKFDKSNNKASSSNDSLAATKGVKDEGMGSCPNLLKVSGNTSLTLLADKMRDFESLMLKGNLVLVGDDGKSINPYNEASHIASSSVVRNKIIMKNVVGGQKDNMERTENVTNVTNIAKHIDIGPRANDNLYESWKETLDDDYDPYDDDVYNANGLSEDQKAFYDALDIKLRGHMRK
nr:hypothetical protein [Tanacetum cinerariifolium]